MRSHVAFIREDQCIGCTKCIDVCPTDAIIGAKDCSHTVIKDLCIACDLCLPPCPVNCIDLIPLEYDRETQKTRALDAKDRIRARLKRLEKVREIEAEKLTALRNQTAEERKAAIARALSRNINEPK